MYCLLHFTHIISAQYLLSHIQDKQKVMEATIQSSSSSNKTSTSSTCHIDRTCHAVKQSASSYCQEKRSKQTECNHSTRKCRETTFNKLNLDKIKVESSSSGQSSYSLLVCISIYLI